MDRLYFFKNQNFTRKYANIGIRIGRAMYRRDGTTLDDLLRVTEGMYANKHSRKPLAAGAARDAAAASLKDLGVEDAMSN